MKPAFFCIYTQRTSDMKPPRRPTDLDYLADLDSLVHLNTDLYISPGFPDGTSGKEPACQSRRHKTHRFDPWVRKIPLEEEMATHSSTLIWRIPWTKEPGGLQTMGSQRVRHN